MRVLGVILALACASASVVVSPETASASVAAFPKTASGVEAKISVESVRATASQVAIPRQEIGCPSPKTAVGAIHDPINNRDPTGRCVWEKSSEEQAACWRRAEEWGVQNAKSRYEAFFKKLVDERPAVLGSEIDNPELMTIFAIYSMRTGMMVTVMKAKLAGADMDGDSLHRYMVQLFARRMMDDAVQLKARPIMRTPDERKELARKSLPEVALNNISGLRESTDLTESLLGRDVNRYFWGRARPWRSRLDTLYGIEKWVRGEGARTNPRYPFAANGGDFFLEKGRADRRRCSDTELVPDFDQPDAECVQSTGNP